MDTVCNHGDDENLKKDSIVTLLKTPPLHQQLLLSQILVLNSYENNNLY